MNGELEAALQEAVNAVLNERLKAHSAQVEARLVEWLINTAKKKPVPDLDKRLQEMSVEIKRMVENLSLDYRNGQLVVKASGTAEETLRKLRLGTLWFDPVPDVTTLILSGIYAE